MCRAFICRKVELVPKFKVLILFPTGMKIDSELEENEVFTSREDAEEYGLEWCSNYHAGGEVLHLSNPLEYPPDEEGSIDFEVVEIED